MNQTPLTLEQLISQRRTIHEFQSGRVPEPALILKALETARWAPNHHLTEPWHFSLLGPETQAAICQLNYELVKQAKGEQIAEKKRQRWQAVPGWLLVSCDKSDEPQRQLEDYAAVCCVIHNLSLLLWEQGVGMKWTTGQVTRDPGFYELLWMDPAVQTVVGLLWYGYPDEIPAATRKPLQNCLTELP